LDRTIDSGITDLGKFAFLIKLLSLTIEGVALVKDSEKKFHTKRPAKR